MQRLVAVLVVTTILLFAGLLAWKAEAMVGAGNAQLATAAKASSAITQAACGGTGSHCPPGYVWNGNRCVHC